MTVTRTDEDAAGQRNLGVVLFSFNFSGLCLDPFGTYPWPPRRNCVLLYPSGVRSPALITFHTGMPVASWPTFTVILRASHSKRNASREGNLSVGSNQNGSAYEKLARMDEGLRVEADDLDDDGDDTDSDESRSVSRQLRPRSCSSRLRSRLLVSASKTPRTKKDLVEKRRS